MADHRYISELQSGQRKGDKEKDKEKGRDKDKEDSDSVLGTTTQHANPTHPTDKLADKQPSQPKPSFAPPI